MIAKATNTSPGPSIAIRRPALAGPASALALSIHPETAVAAVSSSGCSTSDASNDACAGLLSVTADAATTAAAYTTADGAPARISAPVTPMAMACRA